MNILYLTTQWPKRNINAVRDLCFGTCQTLLNLNHTVSAASIDASIAQTDEEGMHPLKYIQISAKKTHQSLQNLKITPNLIIFNSVQAQNIFSAYFYNRFNKCPKILQINTLEGLRTIRKSKISDVNIQSLVQSQLQMIPQTQNIFTEEQTKAIERSDHLFIGNQFLHTIIKKKYSPQFSSLVSFGFPTKQFSYQRVNLQFRPFQLRKNFFFIGDLSKQSSIATIQTLVQGIWPLIKSKLPDAELHIYGSRTQQKIKKRQFTGKDIKYKGFLQQIQDISKYKALLYPDRIGCGIKGKIVDSWFNHTPVVTTPIGAQGMFVQRMDLNNCFNDQDASKSMGFTSERYLSESQKKMEQILKLYYQSNSFYCKASKQFTFGGSFRNFNYYDFAQSAYRIYTDQAYWNQCVNNSYRTILRNFNQKSLQRNLTDLLNKIDYKLSISRKTDRHSEAWKKYMKTKQFHDKVKGKY